MRRRSAGGQPEVERKGANIGGDCSNEDEYPFMEDLYAFSASDLGEEERNDRSFILEGFGEGPSPENRRTASTLFQRWKHARGIWSPGVAEILEGNDRRILR